VSVCFHLCRDARDVLALMDDMTKIKTGSTAAENAAYGDGALETRSE